jgi:hypothetical protein
LSESKRQTAYVRHGHKVVLIFKLTIVASSAQSAPPCQLIRAAELTSIVNKAEGGSSDCEVYAYFLLGGGGGGGSSDGLAVEILNDRRACKCRLGLC